MTKVYMEEDSMTDTLLARLLDSHNQLTQEVRESKEMLHLLLSNLGVEKPIVTKEEAEDIGMRVAAMDEKRFVSIEDRPPKPELPQEAIELARKLDLLVARGSTNAALTEIINPLLEQREHRPMYENYIYKMRTPEKNFHYWEDGQWKSAVSFERSRMKDLVAIVDFLVG